MKYITFAVPCYNSENYMRRCVDSLLIGGKDVEINVLLIRKIYITGGKDELI